MTAKHVLVAVLAAALAATLGLPLIRGGAEVPPEPDFPITRVVADEPGWLDDGDWSPNSAVRNPFEPLVEPGAENPAS